MTNTAPSTTHTAENDIAVAEPAPFAGAALIAAAIGGAVSVSLGLYGRLHTPSGRGIFDFGFGAVLPMKAWFATGAAALVIVQITTAAGMWGRLPGMSTAPRWVAQAHRWSGTAAFLLTLPIAYHCLWSLGFQQTSTRVLAHSILGCAFYGAFTTKMLLLHSKRVPSKVMPFAGGALAAILTLIWFTSSLWFFQNHGFPGV